MAAGGGVKFVEPTFSGTIRLINGQTGEAYELPGDSVRLTTRNGSVLIESSGKVTIELENAHLPLPPTHRRGHP